MRALKFSNFVRHDPDRPSLRERAASLKASAARVMRRKPADPFEGVPCPPGFVPYPPDAPTSYLKTSVMLQEEGERLLRLAVRELDRRLDAMEGRYSDHERQQHEATIRQHLRIDVLMQLATRPGLGTDLGDTGLLALEAEFLAADAACVAASDRLDEAENAYAGPSMPSALRVWSNDWVFSSIPRPDTMPFGDDKVRQCPYGEKEVELLRGKAHTRRIVGGPNPGGRIVADTMAQERGDAIVAAWDEWQSARGAAREAVNLPALEAARRSTIASRNAVLLHIRETPACSVVGLGVKARTAADMACASDMREASSHFGPSDPDGLLYALAADAIELAGNAGEPARG